MKNPLTVLGYRLFQQICHCVILVARWPRHEMIAGKDSVFQIPDILLRYRKKRVLVIAGPHVSKLGSVQSFLEKLKEREIEYLLFTNVKGEPTTGVIDQAVRLYHRERCQALVAIGGGSQIDCAKMVAAKIARSKKELIKLVGCMKVRKKLPLLIAVPTTSGSGSEVTACAVVSIPRRENGSIQASVMDKRAAMDLALIPRYAVLDPVLTLSAPPSVTAYTGMDALVHALEAYLGKFCSAKQAYEAEWAIKLITENLADAYGAGDDLFSREKMQQGAYFAGKVFTRCFVGYIHAFAHAIGGRYGIAHGKVVAIAAPYILRWYGKTVWFDLSRLASVMEYENPADSDSVKAEWFIGRLEELNAGMGIPDRVEELLEEDLEDLAKSILREANPLYPVPRIMSRRECIDVLRQMK